MGALKAPDAIRSVQQALAEFLKNLPSEHLTLALSGGMDSIVLMHALSETGVAFRAVHVHHGLHRHADAWAAHCQAVAKALAVPYKVLPVHVQTRRKGLEAAARAERYQALFSEIPQGGVLLTAHHQRDQAETVLLNLLRGSGVRGLQGMPALVSWEDKWLGRPLLSVPYGVLRQYARHRHLKWMEDPSNRTGRFLRNRVRYAVLPFLRRLQPDIEQKLVKTAMHHQAAERLLAQYAEHLLTEVLHEGRLHVAALCRLDRDARNHVLRYWFRTKHRVWLNENHLKAIDTLLFAQADRQPEVKIGASLLKRFQGLLWYPACEPEPWQSLSWQARDQCPFEIKGQIEHARDIVLMPFIHTGLAIKPYKKAFQAAGIPPWLRPHWPVIMRMGKPVYILNVGAVVGADQTAMYARVRAAFHC